jgi:hypothetical protein
MISDWFLFSLGITECGLERKSSTYNIGLDLRQAVKSTSSCIMQDSIPWWQQGIGNLVLIYLDAWIWIPQVVACMADSLPIVRCYLLCAIRSGFPKCMIDLFAFPCFWIGWLVPQLNNTIHRKLLYSHFSLAPFIHCTRYVRAVFPTGNANEYHLSR